MFGMFRSAKARMQIGPFIEQAKYLLHHNGIHLNAGDWDDPYLIGYYHAGTYAILYAGSNGRLSPEDVGMVQAWGWEQLTSLPGKLYLTRTLMHQEARTDEWEDGTEKGIIWGRLLTGNVTPSTASFEYTELIESGRDLARLSGAPTDPSSNLQNAAALAFSRDWYQYIADKHRRRA